jgi:hypothetical protein
LEEEQSSGSRKYDASPVPSPKFSNIPWNSEASSCAISLFSSFSKCYTRFSTLPSLPRTVLVGSGEYGVAARWNSSPSTCKARRAGGGTASSLKWLAWTWWSMLRDCDHVLGCSPDWEGLRTPRDHLFLGMWCEIGPLSFECHWSLRERQNRTNNRRLLISAFEHTNRLFHESLKPGVDRHSVVHNISVKSSGST